jgi:2-hydroxy-3-keto-5-methylthiopentenyl-1-phosphate phosphatase
VIRLLCTFTTEDNLQSVINDISTNYDILNGKIFILQLSENPELACTYNIESGNLNNLLDNTISIHRRKENNVLYTINGLNYLIKSLNNNILDKEYKVNWDDYSNSALLVTDGQLVIHQLQIYKIVYIK